MLSVETQWTHDRMQLFKLRRKQPDWSYQKLADVLDYSISWVKKWLKRFVEAKVYDMDIFSSQSRSPKKPSRKVTEAVREVILTLRQKLPEQYGRVTGSKTILYHLHHDGHFASKEDLPRSPTTIWQVLKEAGYMPKRVKRHVPLDPSPPMQESETPAPTNTTILPSETAIPTYTSVPTYTPTQPFQQIPLEDAILWTEENLGLPYGEIIIQDFKGISFEIGRGMSTAGCESGNTTNNIEIPVNIANSSAIHFLIQGGNILYQYDEMTIGSILISMSDSTSFAVPLIIGHNIRDWKINTSLAVTTLTSENTIEAWANDTGRIDMLTVTLPEFYSRNLAIMNIEIIDLSDLAVSDPCIHLSAITVETVSD